MTQQRQQGRTDRPQRTSQIRLTAKSALAPLVYSERSRQFRFKKLGHIGRLNPDTASLRDIATWNNELLSLLIEGGLLEKGDE